MRFQNSRFARVETASRLEEKTNPEHRDEASQTVVIDPDCHQVEIGMALQRVTSHEIIRKSPKLQAFLTFVVSETLAGRGDRLKAYSIAVAALGKHSGFDPVTDPIVRVEASRLRRSLEIYYATDGQSVPIRITMPVGSYQPIFTRRGVNLKVVKSSHARDQNGGPSDLNELEAEIPTPFDIISASRPIWDKISRVITPRVTRLILITNTILMVFMILFGFKLLFLIENMDRQMHLFQAYWEAHLASNSQ